MIVPRIQRAYNSLINSPYAKPVALIATGVLVCGLIISITADLSFISFSQGIFWDANPNELSSQINAQIAESGRSSSIIDGFYGWVIKNISFKTTAHMLAGNTLAMLTSLFLLGFLVKEFFRPNGYLPVAHYSKRTRYIFGTMAGSACICMLYFYIYVLTSADMKKFDYNNDKNSAQSEFSINETNLDSSSHDIISTPIKENNNYPSSRRMAFICFAIGMFFTTFFAFYGSLMFIRVVGTLTAILFLFFSRAVSQLIEIPYLYAGKRIGAIKLNLNTPNNESVKETDELVSQKIHNHESNKNLESQKNSNSNEAVAEFDNSNEEIRNHTEEDERQRLINKNPLGI